MDKKYNDEYFMYYTNILKQMKQQKFSSTQIAVQKMMYEKRADLYETFVDRYDFENPYNESESDE